MRALLLLALALAVLGIAFLGSRVGSPGGSGVEPTTREIGDAPAPEGLFPPADPREDPETRVEATGAELDEPESRDATRPSVGPRSQGRGEDAHPETILVIRMLTPEGEPLREALKGVDGGPEATGKGEVVLEALVSLEAPEIGTSVSFLPHRQEEYPFVESRVRPTKGAPLGTVRVLAIRCTEPSVFVCALANRRVVAVQHVQRDVGEVTFVLSTDSALAGHGRFRVCFVDGAGAPVEGVLLAPHAGWSQFGRTLSDAYGNAEVESLRPGLYDYDASQVGFATARFRFPLGPGERLDLGRVVLRAPVTIRGQLVGPRLEIGGREVIVRRIPTSDSPADQGYEWRPASDSEGRFSLTGLEPGAYALRVDTFARWRPGRRNLLELSWLSPFVHVDATGGSLEELSIQLEPKNTVTVHTHFPEGDDVDLRVLDSGGLVVFHTTLCPDECELDVPLPFGRFRLEAKVGDRVETVPIEAKDGFEVHVGR